MITAIDTNLLLDVLIPNERFFSSSLGAIETAAAEGSLVICDLVYAELCIHFGTQRDCDEFLEANDIRVEPLSRAAHFHAGRVWRSWRKQGGRKSRILLDFLIASHAELQADRLLSRDRGFYRELFPSLTLIDPSRD